jgi:hypothetical protein
MFLQTISLAVMVEKLIIIFAIDSKTFYSASYSMYNRIIAGISYHFNLMKRFNGFHNLHLKKNNLKRKIKMNDRQFPWGLANGVMALALTGLCWIGLGIGSYADTVC